MPNISASECDNLSNSIHPSTIPKSNKEIKKLLECLVKDSELYLGSVVDKEKFQLHFQEKILPRLEKSNLIKDFSNEINKYARIEISKTTFVRGNLAKIWRETAEDIEWWMEKYIKAKVRVRGEKDVLSFDDLTDLLKISYGDFVHLSVLLSQMFFALEFSCKLICSFGCYRFALKISKSEVIQHNEIWKQLKKLSNKTGVDCDVCAIKESCYFDVNFASLSRIYAYAMKIRQIVDYTPRLASFNIFNSGLFEPPLNYFSSLTKIADANFALIKDCFPKDYEFTPFRFKLNSHRMKLQKPFSWDENELKRLLKENSKDSTSWYLLGRLYYKQNDNDEAIKCLERARRINLKNADAWLMLGILYDGEARNRREEQKALRYMEKARELNPRSFEAILGASILNIALGNCTRGAKFLEEGLTLPLKNDELCAFNQGLYYAYSKLGNQLKADTYLKNAKKLCDKYQEKLVKFLTEYFAERAKFFRN